MLIQEECSCNVFSVGRSVLLLWCKERFVSFESDIKQSDIFSLV
jgi:hypothetical protein